MGALISILLATMVYLERCNTLQYDEARLPGAQILKGNVRFRHDNALMYCDSAYFYERTNSLTAFSHVRLVQGDTLSGYSDVMYYNGNTKLARFKRNVRLVHRHTTLTTDSLNFDRNTNMGWYYTGGTIVDSLNTLTSIWGQYLTSSSDAEFRQEVKLVNDKYILTTERLQYNTDTRLANLVVPTEIVYEGDTRILSSRGWYNTESEQSMLLRRSRIIKNDGKLLVGDTIYSDKKIGYRRAIGNVESVDSVQKSTVYGDYAEMYEDHNRGYVTRRALMIDWSNAEDSVYMHADTVYSADIDYRLDTDSGQIDTVYREMRGHHNVRMYKKDAQAICGLAVFNDRDSTVHLYENPVCWNEQQQLSADSVILYMQNEKVEHIHAFVNALVVKQLSRQYYNQMTGKEILAWMRDDELREMNISGNAQTIFYPDEDGALIGMNTTESSFITIYFKDGEIEHALFTSETNGTLYPLDQVPPGTDRLAPFFWAEDKRPMSPEDVMVEKGGVDRPKAGVASASGKSAARPAEQVTDNHQQEE